MNFLFPDPYSSRLNLRQVFDALKKMRKVATYLIIPGKPRRSPLKIKFKIKKPDNFNFCSGGYVAVWRG